MNNRDSTVASIRWHFILFPHQSLAVKSWYVALVHDVIEEPGSLFSIFPHACALVPRSACCFLFTSCTTLSFLVYTTRGNRIPPTQEESVFTGQVLCSHPSQLPWSSAAPDKMPGWIFLHILLKVVQHVNFKIGFHQNNGSIALFSLLSSRHL